MINVLVFSAWELAGLAELWLHNPVNKARLGDSNAAAIPDFVHPTPTTIDLLRACCIPSEGQFRKQSENVERSVSLFLTLFLNPLRQTLSPACDSRIRDTLRDYSDGRKKKLFLWIFDQLSVRGHEDGGDDDVGIPVRTVSMMSTSLRPRQ